MRSALCPVSRITSCTKVMPSRLMIEFAVAVAMISRRRRWFRMDLR